MRKIVSIGECMVELSPNGEGLWKLGFAGDTLNSAWYLRARLGAEWTVAYYTRLGTDRFSGETLEFLAAGGIDTAAIQRDATRSVGLYAISLDKGERSFTYWRGQSAAKLLADDPAHLAAALDGAEMAYFSGITLAILSPEGREALFSVLRDFRAKGGRVAFDPNIRERLWEDHETLRKVITAAGAVSDIVLPSFDDEAKWFGDADPAATRARYAALGAEEIVVKNGGGEMCLWRAGEAIRHVTYPEVVPIDTTGAGDSFNGGYLAARLSGRTPEAAAQAAHDLAARVVCHRGALLPQEACGG